MKSIPLFLLALALAAPGARAQQCVTRTIDFWFSNPANRAEGNSCATLLKAIDANGGVMDLGFMCLPTAERNGDSVTDSVDALWEAEGFYWKYRNNTGDGKDASTLCRARKQLALQLIAAIANVKLLGTDPATCGFDPDLLTQARQAAACEDLIAIQHFQEALDAFNNSGKNANLPEPLQECRANPRGARAIAVDPTTRTICDDTANCAAGAACP
jgi:hypothetical protein